MKQIREVLMLILVLSTLNTNAQNVGIGTLTPTDAKLHVENAGTSTLASFSDGTTALSIINELGRPSVGFNMNYIGGYKFKGNGFGGLLYYVPGEGRLTYYSSTVTGVAGGSVLFSSILTMQADGNVGIGTTSPTEAKLQVHEPAGNTQFIAAAGNNLPGISAFVPSSSPSLGFNIRYQNGLKFMGPGYGGYFQYSPSLGKLYYLYSSTKGVADGGVAGITALVIDSSGRLGIGTTLPTAPLHVTGNVVFGASSIEPALGYKLSVDGKIICEELKVQLNTAWPDYVFEESYKMPTLELLEEQVMTEKHLPGIPAASEVESAKGVQIGAVQQKMLEKIEELYRYVFEMNKENKLLKKEVDLLKKQVQSHQ